MHVMLSAEILSFIHYALPPCLSVAGYLSPWLLVSEQKGRAWSISTSASKEAWQFLHCLCCLSFSNTVQNYYGKLFGGYVVNTCVSVQKSPPSQLWRFEHKCFKVATVRRIRTLVAVSINYLIQSFLPRTFEFHLHLGKQVKQEENLLTLSSCTGPSKQMPRTWER